MATRKKAKSSGSKRKKKGSGFALSSFLTRDQQMDILAVGLLALAVFTALALVPVSWFGERAPTWFPSGNPMGVVGGAVAGVLTSLFGVGAYMVPPTFFFGGLFAGGWGNSQTTGRLTLFSGGLLLLVPIIVDVVTRGAEVGGWWGGTVAGPLTSLIGWLGAMLLMAVLFVLLSVLVLRWNPLRTVGKGVTAGGEVVGGLLADGGRRVGEWWRSRPVREAEVVGGREAPDEDGPSSEPVDTRVSAAQRREEEEVAIAPPAAPPAPGKPVEEQIDETPQPSYDDDQLPSLDLLEASEAISRRDMEAELDRLGSVLVEKLRTFNVESELGGRTTGPVVTQFEVVPAPGVKVNRIANLDADLALAMKAPSVRIVAPIPGKGAVGVEIPNPSPGMVRLRDVLEGREFQAARSAMPLGLGEDLTGKPYVADLTKMPHLLIAGATGSGKSVCVNTIITSLVYRHTPETLRFLMIDPKMVELSTYADLPHLRHPVVTDPNEAAGVLRWAVLEMERRYQLLQANGVRSIKEFNKRVRAGTVMRRAEAEGEEGDEDRWIYDDGVLPFVVVVVDELADLMMQVQGDVERPLAQLAQKARAIGIHLIVATQRPSVNVITGLIKANFPTRIAFRVASKTDSRTILDQNGAEALLGNGDMLFLPPGQSEPVRVQGAFIDTEETDRLIDWYREQEAQRREAELDALQLPVREADILEELRSQEAEEALTVFEEAKAEWDELFRPAAEVCLQNQGGSTSLLQRKLRIGYGRAARIVDQLHDAGVLGPPDGSKPRELLVSWDELDQISPS